MPPKQKKYLDFPAKIGLVIGLSLYFMVLPLMADKIYVSTQTGGQLGGLTFKNEDILKFDSADKSGGDKGTWSILFDGSNVGLSRHRIDGFYIADDYILLSFSSKPMIEIQGRKIRVGGSDIVKFNWDSLGEETTSGRFEMYFDGSDVGVKKNIDALSLDENGKLVFSVNRRNRLKQADGQSFIVRKQDLVRFTGTNGIDTVGSFERYLDGRKAGLRRLGEDIDGVDLDHSHVYLTTRGRFGVDAIKGRNEDILRCDLVSIPIEQCINPLIVFNGSDFEFSRENLQGIQVEITTIANDDEFTIGQNEVLTGANVMNDNGHGPDTDPQNDPLTVARVNGDPAKVNMTFSLESGALLKLQADGSITYDTHHRFDHLGASGQGQDRFDYRVVDGSGDYAEATVTIHVNGKNDAPTDIVLTGASAPENSPPGTVVGDFATTDPDEGDTHGYGLVSGVGDADNALFQVVGSQLQSAAVFDFETKASYSIRVRSSDAGGLPVDKQFTITVTDANDAPTDILLSSSVVPESQPIGSVVGTFSSTDIDASDTHTFSLAAGEGDSGNDSFQIIGNQLQTAAVFNSSAQSDYSIRVRSTDSASLTVEKQFSLTVVSINHAPSFTKGSDQIVDEDSGPVTVGAWAAAIDDGDSNAVQNLTFDITNNDNPALFSAGPAVSASGQLTYTPAADAHGSAVITLTLADDGGTANGGQDTSAPQSFTITVNSVNDRPDFSAVNPPAVDEDAGPQLVSSWASFSPGPGNESSQKISAYSVSGISNPALFGSQPAVAANGSLTYTPAADANGSATFQVTVKDDGGTVNGGIDTSLAKQFTVTVNAVDDPPVAVSDSASVSEDSGANPIAVLLNDTDVDGGTKLIGAVSKSTTGTVVITGGGTGLSYQPHPNYCNSLSNTPDTFTYTLTPGNSTAAVNVSVICVNDAPVAQNKTGVNIQANMKRTGIDAGLLSGITDPDAGVDGCTPVFSLASVNSVSGGTVSNVNSTAGTFDFEPNAGFTGSATVNYTIQDNGCPGPAATSGTASITLSVNGPVIWFVDPSSGVNGNGTLSSPFNNLASADAVDKSGERIFLYSGTLAGGIALNANEWLIGQGVTGTTFDSLFAITPPAGTQTRPVLSQAKPVVQGAVTMASNDSVRGLTVQPGSGIQGLSATGATGLTVGEVNVATSNAAAVNLVNSDGTFGFTSISANGGGNGIVWNNASLAGGSFTVDGDGSNTTVGGNASGGTIANMSGGNGTTSGIGVYLNKAANVTLRRMAINGTNQNFGIRGFSVNNFALEYSTVSGVNGNSVSGIGEGSVYFGDDDTRNGLTGTASITASSISGGSADNFRVYNTAGSLNRIMIANSTFGLNQNGANDSVGLSARNSGTVLNATATGNTFTGAPGDLFEFTGQLNTTMDLIFQNNTLSNSHSGNMIGGGGMTVQTQGTMSFNVSDNTMRDANGSALVLFKALDGTSLNGTVNNNTIGAAGIADSGSKTGNGIYIVYAGTGSGKLAITNNTIRNYSGNAGIFDDNTGGSYDLDLTITGNTTAEPGSGVFSGLALAAGAPGSSDDIDVCADIKSNNFSAGDPNNFNDVVVAVSTGASSMRLPGYSGSSLAHVQNFILGNNNNAGTTVLAYTDSPATAANFIGGSACQLP